MPNLEGPMGRGGQSGRNQNFSQLAESRNGREGQFGRNQNFSQVAESRVSGGYRSGLGQPRNPDEDSKKEVVPGRRDGRFIGR